MGRAQAGQAMKELSHGHDELPTLRARGWEKEGRAWGWSGAGMKGESKGLRGGSRVDQGVELGAAAWVQILPGHILAESS